MTMGSSLAHGLAKKELREYAEDFATRFSQLESKLLSETSKRASRYRQIRDSLLELYGDEVVLFSEDGTTTGKKKNDSALILAFAPYYEEDELGMMFHFHKLSARSPSIKVSQISKFNKHSIARFYQTYELESMAEIFRNNFDDIVALMTLEASLIKKCAKEKIQPLQLSLSKGVMRFLFDPIENLMDVKTIIAYSAMTPEISSEWENLIGKNMAIGWKNYNSSLEDISTPFST